MAVADDAGSMNYPDRSALIADMCGLWKAARRAPPEEAPGSCLDGDGWERLYRLAERLVRHLNFEYLEQRKLRNVLVGAVRQYKDPPDGKRPNGRQFAAEILDGLAREPMRRTLYLGVQHLKLPHAVTVGEVRFLLLSHDEELAQAFARLGDAAPELVCEVEAAGNGGPRASLRPPARTAFPRTAWQGGALRLLAPPRRSGWPARPAAGRCGPSHRRTARCGWPTVRRTPHRAARQPGSRAARYPATAGTGQGSATSPHPGRCRGPAPPGPTRGRHRAGAGPPQLAGHAAAPDWPASAAARLPTRRSRSPAQVPCSMSRPPPAGRRGEPAPVQERCVIVFPGVPPRLAAPRLVQEAQEPAQVTGRCQPRILRRADHRRAQEIPVQVDVVLQCRGDQERHPSGTSSASSHASRSSAGPPGSATSGRSSDRRGIPRLVSTTRHRSSVTESNHSVRSADTGRRTC